MGRAKEYNPSLDEEGSGPKSGLTQRSASSSSNIMFGSTPFQQALRSLVWFRASDCNWLTTSHLKVVRSTRTGEIFFAPEESYISKPAKLRIKICDQQARSSLVLSDQIKSHIERHPPDQVE